MKINNKDIGPGHPTYIVAEMSSNHNHSFEQAVKIIVCAKDAGADAIKVQTYTPDTMTIDCYNKYFSLEETIWKKDTLYTLYERSHMPWEWQPKLKVIANDIGLDFFSTPFDETAVDFLEEMNVPAYKIASFEIVDFELLRKVAKTGKPVIISTGLASRNEIFEAYAILISNEYYKAPDVLKQRALLKCISSYPALPEEMNLQSITSMSEVYKLPIGLSDHSLGIVVPIVAVSLGACIIEKHFTLSRKIETPDSRFSLEPQEFKIMVDAIRITEQALGKKDYKISNREKKNLVFRRSLFVVKDMKKGDVFSKENIRSIRPGYGLPPKDIDDIIGKKATRNIKRGTPLNRYMVK